MKHAGSSTSHPAPPGRSSRRWAALALAAVAPLAAAAGASAQAPDETRPAAEPAEPGSAQKTPVEPTDVETPGHLLREGSALVETRGTMHRPEPDGPWHFVVTDDKQAVVHDMPLLPCKLLGSMEQLVASMPQERLTFELTGRLFVYRGRNYLLPTHAPRFATHVPAVPDPRQDEPESQPASTDPEEILRDLDRRVGRVVRAPRRDAAPPATGGEGPQLLPEGSIILWRRGLLRRDPGGAWTFVFQADAQGMADPPMVLLPCLMLERMEQRTEQGRSQNPLLVTGRVFTHDQRNYLLPTAFQVPRHRTVLNP